eukprot:10575742-Alexandrium_andersonii.AAC.1
MVAFGPLPSKLSQPSCPTQPACWLRGGPRRPGRGRLAALCSPRMWTMGGSPAQLTGPNPPPGGCAGPAPSGASMSSLPRSSWGRRWRGRWAKWSTPSTSR